MTLVRSVLNLVWALSETLVRENSICSCKLELKVCTQLPPQLRPGMVSVVCKPGTLVGFRTSLLIMLYRNHTESFCPKWWSRLMLYSFWCWVLGSASNALLLKLGSKVPAVGSTL